MAIIIGWKGVEGRKWPERLDIDPGHLDADEIKNLKETKQWFPYDESDQDRWKVIGRPRLRITREQWDRESRFRDNVLDEDGRCVISEETTRAVLDAAHLRPVKEGGEECIENGFILRTDLHRLFDRGMFFISPEDGTIVFDKNLSKYYKELLCHSRLLQPTRCRVREALQERWENPWT